MGPRSTRHVRFHAPGASAASVVVRSCHDATDNSEVAAGPEPGQAGWWIAAVEAADGDRYDIRVDGGPPLFDPHCRDLDVTDDGPAQRRPRPVAAASAGSAVSPTRPSSTSCT